MTKQDFELIARVIRRADTCTSEIINAREVALMFADEFLTTNTRFNSERFIAACVGEDSTDSAGRTIRYSDAR